MSGTVTISVTEYNKLRDFHEKLNHKMVHVSHMVGISGFPSIDYFITKERAVEKIAEVNASFVERNTRLEKEHVRLVEENENLNKTVHDLLMAVENLIPEPEEKKWWQFWKKEPEQTFIINLRREFDESEKCMFEDICEMLNLGKCDEKK